MYPLTSGIHDSKDVMVLMVDNGHVEHML